jgi:myo-inositol-1(or 4)-monophosphatase
MQRELFAARRGGGATLNGRRIRVSGTRSMRRATVELGWSTRRSLKRYTAMVGGVFDTGAGVLRQGSGALGMAYVACGRTDGYGELHINSWDVLAGLVLVREAGGWTNDFLAGNGLRTGNPILACTPGIRAALGEATGLGA